ncbi:alpha/beta hydrolase [Actinoplanes sp. CA-252034]|uniref:alpha/beta hydrolase n=1 Tax=Actinoplanes sp. CA-252034 TaxID=3239906 RepID=UPI003D98BD13
MRLTGILLPGRLYTTAGTLFDLADAVLAGQGDAVEHVTWLAPEGLLDIDPEPFVRVHAVAALHRIDPSTRPILIAKSLGTRAAGLAAELSLPAIWLTPLLTDATVTAAITANRAPALLLGGDADPYWDTAAAHATGKTVVTIPGADHAMRVPGPIRRYTDVLATIGTNIEQFLHTVRSGQP